MASFPIRTVRAARAPHPGAPPGPGRPGRRRRRSSGARAPGARRRHRPRKRSYRPRIVNSGGRYVCRMQVVANGNAVELDEGATLDDLLVRMGLGAKWVVVERNGEPVPRREPAPTVPPGGDP